jgi:hypothetical protein
MHLKQIAGYQISILIFENKLWRGVSTIPLTQPKVGTNFAVLDIFFMGYL